VSVGVWEQPASLKIFKIKWYVEGSIMSTAVIANTTKRASGGGFLIEDVLPEDIFTPEDFSSEQKQIAQVASDFAQEKIFPRTQEIEEKKFDVSRSLMRQAGELGLLGADVPEEYGGLGLDKVTSALIADRMAVSGSFTVTYSAHVCIGTLPLIWYGTPQQKEKYLAKLASGEWIAAYALSESSAGSDAMNIRTQAKLSPDGKHYLLNGEKMWISNAGIASLFTVFAKIDGEKFTAFLIEAGTPGLTIGAEEHKLGIRGSSTCPLILEDCKVPVENLLGEAGKGHHIAFNVLNVGRYKLAAVAVGGARKAFRDGIRYAKERIAFGKSITDFGLVQEKIADSAAGIYAGESLVYRTVGSIDAALSGLDKTSPTFVRDVQKGIEEFAVECSILKVWGSEMVERVVDQMLQLYGGYGYVEEFPAERSYRDARINKIFEGTNEINRLIITGWMIKRALQGRLALLPAIKRVMDEVTAGPGTRTVYEGPLADERALLVSAKKLGLFCAGAASQKYGNDLENQQEVMGALADILMEALTLESTILRTEKMDGRNPLAIKLAKYYTARSFRIVETAAERVIGTVAEGDMLRTQMAIFRRLAKHEPVNTVPLGREIAVAMVEAGRYTL
jgi:alkylation response protein AidB-like acyl-CoA dehydrogenase